MGWSRLVLVGAALSLLLLSSAGSAQSLDDGYPQVQQSLFFGPAGPGFGYAAALDPATRELWAAGAGYDSSGPALTGAVVRLENGGVSTSVPLRFGQSGSQCPANGFDYCVAGSSSVVRAVAVDAVRRRLWAAGTQYDAAGANPLLFVAEIDLASRQVVQFQAEASTGTEALGVAVGPDGSAWVVGTDDGAASLWQARDGAPLDPVTDLADYGEADAVAVDASGMVWAVGRDDAGGELALWSYDPVTVTYDEVQWTNSLGGSGSTGRALAVAPGGGLYAAGEAGTGARGAAVLWRFDGESLAAVAASTGTYDEAAYGLALDPGGDEWLTGVTGVAADGSRDLALWKFPMGGSGPLTLAASYHDASYAAAPYADEGRALVYQDGRLWAAGTQDDAAFALWRFTLNTGNVSGTVSYAGGFSGSHALGFFLAYTPLLDGAAINAGVAAPTAGTSGTYALSGLPAPATYYVAAVYDLTDTLGQSDGVPAGDPLGIRRSGTVFTPVFVPAGGTAGAVDIDLALDGAPTASISQPVDGSTITASQFSLDGTADDDALVQAVDLAVHDLTVDEWWDGSAFISTSNAPYPFLRPPLSGSGDAPSWSAPSGSVAALAAALQAGHSYQVVAQAGNIVGLTGTAQSTFVVQSTTVVPGAGDGRALSRGPDGRFWVVAGDASSGQTTNFRLERYDSGGVFLSSVPLSEMTGNNPSAVAFDASGDAWVAGSASTASTQGLGLWKVDPTGATILAATFYVPSFGGQVLGGRLALDASGTVWIAGAEQYASGFQRALWKYASNGSLVSGFPVYSQRGGGLDGAFATAVDASGNVWSAGVSSNPATGRVDFALWKNDSAGAALSGFPVYWPDAVASVDQIDVALAAAPSGGVWAATPKSFAACPNPDYALLRYDASGAQLSSSLWHNAADSGAQVHGLSVDSSGSVWTVGASSEAAVLWKHDASGALASGYPRAFAGSAPFSPYGLALDGAAQPWVLSGDQPSLFQAGATADGAAGPSPCALIGTGQISGTITDAAGFPAGSTVTVVASSSNFKDQPSAFTFFPTGGTTLPYTLSLPAPGSYAIAALEGSLENGGLQPGTTIGIYSHFTPVASQAGQTAAGIDVTVALDAAPPTAAVTSLINGSTVTALSFIAGTAADNVGVDRVALAVQDVDLGLWWDSYQGVWVSTTAAPLYQDGQAALSGPLDAPSWSQDVRASTQTGGMNFGGLNGALAAGRTYRVYALARDFTGQEQSAPSVKTFVWRGPNGQVAPPPPAGVFGYAVGVASVTWNWPPSQNATGYDVYDASSTLLSSQQTDTAFTAAGLSTNTLDAVCVSAVGAAGESAKTCGTGVYTFAAAPGAPQVSAVSSTTITAFWDAAGNPAGTAYGLEFSTDAFASFHTLPGGATENAAVLTLLTPDTDYSLRARAFNEVGTPTDYSAVSATRTAVGPPYPPASIAGAALGVSSIAWSWSASTGAVSYNVYSDTGVFLGSTSSTSFVLTNLSTNAAFGLCVSGVNSAGEGILNCAAGVFTLAAAPAGASFSSVSDHGFGIGWDPAGNPPSTVYQVLLSTDGFVTNVSTPIPFSANHQGTIAQLDGLEFDTLYSVRVQAENGAGLPTDPSPSASTRTLPGPPQAPTGLSAVFDQPVSGVELAWQAASSGTPAATFVLYRGVSPDTTTITQLALTTGTVFTDHPFLSATYYYQVAGVNQGGLVGPRSGVAAVAADLDPPQPVADLRIGAARRSLGQADFAWTASTDGFSGVSRYLLLESPTGDFSNAVATYTIPAQPSGSTITFTVDFSTTQSYFFAVVVQDGAGNRSSYSNSVFFDPAPPAPTGIAGLAIGVSSVSWSWNGSDGAVSYDVFSATGGPLGSASTSTFPQSGLTPDALASICVRGVAAIGPGPVSCGPGVYTLAAVPGAPVVSAPSLTGFTATWDPQENSTATSYQVTLSTDDFSSNVSTPIAFADSFYGTTAAIGSLAPGTTYSIRVQARNGDGRDSAPSTSSTGQTRFPAPDAPTALAAAADHDGRAIVASWTPAASGTPAVSFILYRGVSTDTSTFSEVAATTATTFSDPMTGSGTFYYQVTALNEDALEGPRSLVASAAIDLTPPTAVSDLRVTAVRQAQGQADLAWTAPADDLSGVASYRLLDSPTGDFAHAQDTFTLAALPPGTTVSYTVNVSSTQVLYFTVQSIDSDGNVSAPSNTAPYDPVPPAAPSVDLADAQVLSRPRYLNLGSTDNVGVTRLVLSVDGATAADVPASFYQFFWDTRPLADGEHTLTVDAYDAAGNSSSVTRTVTINYAPPAAPTIQSPYEGFGTQVATISVSGAAEPGVGVDLLADGLDLATAAVVNGGWAFDPATLPAEGDVTLTAIAFENRGFSAPSAPVHIVYASHAPDAPALPTASALSGGVSHLSWSAPLTGKTPSYYRVYRSTDDLDLEPGGPAPAGLRAADHVGSLAYDETPAADDLYFYAVTAVDGAGNESPLSDEVYVLTDRVPPSAQVLISTPPPLTAGSYLVGFQLSEPLALPPIVMFNPPGAQPISLNLTGVTGTYWQATATVTAAMASGPATFSFEGTDLAGNVGTSVSSAAWELDTIGPAGTLALTKPSPVSTGTVGVSLTLDKPALSTPTLSLTPEGGAPLAVALDAAAPYDGTAWTGSLVISSTTGDGTAVFSDSAVDAHGVANSALFGTASFVIDTTAPGEPLVVRANSLPAFQVDVTWSPPFGDRPAYYLVYRDGVRLSTQVAPAADGTGEYLDTAPEGQHQYQVSSVDAAGNESAATDPSAVARGTPPAPPIDSTATINGFGQIQVSWQAGSTDTARFALYRATFAAAGVAGLPLLSPNAVSPLLDTPPLDGVYHYLVTALDSVGNESGPAPEAVVVWAQGAPSVSIGGIADGGYYKSDPAPTFTVEDLTLDTASIHAQLDGQSFVSGTSVTVEGRHLLTVSAANVLGHTTTAQAAFTLIKTPPAISFSVPDGAALKSTAPVSVVVTVGALSPAATSFTLTNQLFGTSVPYDSGAPITDNGQYVLSATATDLAGNASTATVSFTLQNAPLAPRNLTVGIQGDAHLDWASPEPDVVGYRLYRDGQHISASLFTGTSFEDTGYAAGAHVYEVSAVDATGSEGPRARATVPAASLTFPVFTLTRGFFDSLQPSLVNASTAAISAGPAVMTLIDANGAAVASATSAVVGVAAGQPAALPGVVATPPALTASSRLHVSVPVPTDPGAAVYFAGDYTLSAADPKEPLLEVFPDPLVPGTNSAVRIRMYNRGTAPMDVVTAQIAGSTTAPVDDVSVRLQTAQGTLFASNGLAQTGDGANITFAGGRQVFFVSIPAGSSFLFDPVFVQVPSQAAQDLTVVATVSTATYSLPVSPLPGTRSFVSSAVQGTVQQVPYYATAAPERGYYDQGSSVTLSGRVYDASGASLAYSPLVVHVVGGGFSRTVNAVSDSSGGFTAAFFPLPTESGVYNVFATYPTVVAATVQSTFTIVGFDYQYSNYTATLAQNSDFAFTVDLTNNGGAALTGLSASTASVSGSSVTLTLDPATLPDSIPAGGKAVLGLSLHSLPLSTSSNMVLTVRESHGFLRSLPIAATVVAAQAIPSVTPQQFSLGMLGGDVRTVTLVVQNKGFDTWRGVSISNPALSWATVEGPSDLGDIPPGGSANVTLQFAPPFSLPNQTYSPSPLLVLTSQNADPVPVVAAVALTSARKGDVLVSVINADKPLVNGQGVPIADSKVTLTSLDVQGLSYTVNCDLNGLAAFSQIPSGNYAWRAEAAGFQTKSGTAVIEPGMTNQIQAVLATTVVSYQWSVTPTTILDQYNIVLNLTFKTDVPAPAIVVEPPILNLTMDGGQVTYTQITITNKGLVSAKDYKIASHGDPAIQFDIPDTVIPEIKPGQSIVVPVKITLAHASCHNGGIAGLFQYPCAAGIIEQGSAPDVSVSAGQCGGGGNTGTVGRDTGAGFASVVGPASLAVAVGSPSLGGSCSNPGTNSAPSKGTQNESGIVAGSIARLVNIATGLLKISGGGMCKLRKSPELSFQTFYTTFGLDPSDFGYGWTANSNVVVVVNPDGSYGLTDGQGNKYLYVPTGPLNQPVNGSGCQFSRPLTNYSTLQVGPGSAFSTEHPGMPLSIVQRDSQGNTTGFTLFGSSYYPTYFADKNGSTLLYSRDSEGRLLKETDIHGRYLEFAYDAGHHLTSVTDETGRVVSYGYDAAGNRTSFTDVNGDVTHYAFDSNHRITQVTYPNSGTTQFTYYPDGRTASESDDAGNGLLSYAYYVSSTVITDSLGRSRTEWWTEMDGSRKISKIVDAAGGVTSLEFDGQFNVSKVTDPLGRVTQYQHDVNGNVTSVTDAAGQTSQIAYLNAGGPAVFSSSGGGSSSSSGQAVGGMCGGGGSVGSASVSIGALAQPVQLSAPISLPSRLTDPKGNATSLSYDAKYDLIQTQDAAAGMTQYSYDTYGHLTGVKDALGGVTAMTYDEGSLVSVTDPLGRKVDMTRDALSHLSSLTDPAGHRTDFTYDTLDHLTQVKDALNGTTSITYDPGREDRFPKTVTDAKNHATTTNYDVLGRVTGVVNALNQQTHITYDSDSRVTAVTNRNGQNFSLGYDALNRLTQLTTPEGSLNLTYDAVGHLLTASHYNGSSLGMTYDAVDRVSQVTETLPNGFSAALGYTYDANGNRTGMTTPWGSFHYTYDSLNRVTSVTNPNGQTVTFTYDALGRRTKMIYPNGTQTTYAYDAAGQIAQVVHQKMSDQSAIAFTNYSYDAAGNRTGTTDLSGNHTYTYDALNRLASATHPGLSETFAYDAVGNRTSDALRSGYVYDAANRIVSDSSFTYTTDVNGNVTSRTSRATGVTTTFIHNSGNQLTSVTGPGGTIASYKYDAAGRRVEKNVGGTITRFVYDGPNILAILDANNNLLALFTHGPGIDSPLIMRQGSTDYFYHADALGNVVALTDSSGNTIETYKYAAFGKTTIMDAQGAPHGDSTVGNPFMYTSREYDAESGLYFYRARYHDPETGRFFEEDPLASINQYEYAANNPELFTDPLGLCAGRDPVDPGILRLYIWMVDNVEPYGDAYAIAISGIGVAAVGGFLITASLPIAATGPVGWIAASNVFATGLGMVVVGGYVSELGYNMAAGTFYEQSGVNLTVPRVPVITPGGRPPEGRRPWDRNTSQNRHRPRAP